MTGTSRYDEVEEDLRQEDYVELHEATRQFEQQPYTGYAEPMQENDVQADDHHGPDSYVEDFNYDYSQWEGTEPEWHAQEAAEPLEGTLGASDDASAAPGKIEPDVTPENVEPAANDFATTLESDVRQPEITFDETVIDTTGEDNGQPDNNIPQNANGLPQGTSNADAGQRPGTPETTHSLFDVEEDIFKSPMTQKSALAPSAVDLAADSMPGDQGLGTGQPAVEVLDDEEYPNSPSIESGEVVSSEDGDFQLQDEKPLAGGIPTPTKRPRPDDDVDTEENTAPELKRHRYE